MNQPLASAEAYALVRILDQTPSEDVKRAAAAAQLRLAAFLHEAYADAQLAQQIEAARKRMRQAEVRARPFQPSQLFGAARFSWQPEPW